MVSASKYFRVHTNNIIDTSMNTGQDTSPVDQGIVDPPHLYPWVMWKQEAQTYAADSLIVLGVI